jgi:hypothetical protein
MASSQATKPRSARRPARQRSRSSSIIAGEGAAQRVDQRAAELEVVGVDAIDDVDRPVADLGVGHGEQEVAVGGLVGEQVLDGERGLVALLLVLGVEVVDGGAGQQGGGPQLGVHRGDRGR